MITKKPDLRNISLVIFDVDGTLYRQGGLRRKMAVALLKYYLLRPHRIKDIWILYHFRKEREKRPGYSNPDLHSLQYTWCADKLNMSPARVESVVTQWIYHFPLRYLTRCMYKGVADFFSLLRNKNIKIAVYSDYPVVEKLKAMGLEANLATSSTDEEIHSFKPSPRAVHYICEQLQTPRENTLLVGDRYSRDGQCAINAGIRFFILPRKSRDRKKIFVHLAGYFN